ncbi:MAG TPA: phage holin family protein [Thermoleophilaceae bacterium]|nr:phage holin family protein [Thermoleophilaceae bacterium]
MSTNGADKSLGDVVTEVTEKASLLVREEIELAKAEVTEKVTKLGKGAGALAAAGVLVVFALIYLFHSLAWGLVEMFDWNVWFGYLVTVGIILVMGAIAAFLGVRWLKSGAPPMPELAIEEAKRTREMLDQQKLQHDQLGRGEHV